jgi:hypothetical protein
MQGVTKRNKAPQPQDTLVAAHERGSVDADLIRTAMNHTLGSFLPTNLPHDGCRDWIV